MTARPDEVVAEMSIEDAIAVFDKSATRTTPNAQTRAWSLLRGAFAEYQAAAGMLAVERAEFRIRAEKAETALQSANARLAAVLALADEWERIGLERNFTPLPSAKRLELCAAELRRAAAGEGDGNQGDSNA